MADHADDEVGENSEYSLASSTEESSAASSSSSSSASLPGPSSLEAYTPYPPEAYVPFVTRSDLQEPLDMGPAILPGPQAPLRAPPPSPTGTAPPPAARAFNPSAEASARYRHALAAAHGHSHEHHAAAAHAHAHAHAHSHAAPPPPGHQPPPPQPPHQHYRPPPSPVRRVERRVVRQAPPNQPQQPQMPANQNSNQLGAVRDRLFQAMLVRMALWYTARVNRSARRVIEVGALVLAILSFLSLVIVHSMFMRVSTTCLQDIESSWPREGIVRVEVVRNLEMLHRKQEQFKEYREAHEAERARAPPPVCRFSAREVLQRGPAVIPAEIREFGYRTVRRKQQRERSPMAVFVQDIFAIGESWEEAREEVEEEQTESEDDLGVLFDREFNQFYEPDQLPYYEYRVEYSLIYGLLRLPARFVAQHNVQVLTKQIDAEDACLGSGAARWLMANVVGYEDPVLHTLKALAVNESDIGYVHDLRSNDHYHFVQLATSRLSYVSATVVMLLFTFAISLLLRFSHHQIFLFIVDLLHMFEHNQPLAFPAAPLLTVILALVGMEAIMSEVFNDTTTAFYVILIVWLADQFDAICCQSPTSKRYWLRFFFIHQFFFYAYQYRFGGVYGGLALLTSSLFILHSMIYFFHHYEIPLILYTDRLQRIMTELNGRMQDPPVVQEVNLATGPSREPSPPPPPPPPHQPHPHHAQPGVFNRAVGSPPHAVGLNGIRRVLLPGRRGGGPREAIGIPLHSHGNPGQQSAFEHGLAAAAERRVHDLQQAAATENTWIRSIARSVGGRLVNTIPSWMVGGAAAAAAPGSQAAGAQQQQQQQPRGGVRVRFRLNGRLPGDPLHAAHAAANDPPEMEL